MGSKLVLASGSSSRAQMLHNASVDFEAIKPRVDEEAVLRALQLEGASPRDIADALAESKVRKVSAKMPGAVVLGCDQVLDFKGEILTKPKTVDDARSQLQKLRSERHMLLSAAVIYKDGEPLWRFIGTARLFMRSFSDEFLDAYLERNWDEIQHCVGAYMLEAEGVRLFEKVDGDYFTVLGMPLVEILSYLTLQGELPK